jgi:hypothetical protein
MQLVSLFYSFPEVASRGYFVAILLGLKIYYIIELRFHLNLKIHKTGSNII